MSTPTSEPPISENRFFSGLRRRTNFFLSLMTIYSALILLGRWLIGPALFSGKPLNPYLLVVLWAAVRHGWIEGVIAAALGCFLMMTLPVSSVPLALATDRTSEFLLLTVGLFAAALADANRLRLENLRAVAAEQGVRLVRLAEEEAILRQANTQLRERFSSQEGNLAVLQDIAQRLQVVSEDEIFAAIVEILADHLEADQCSVYRVDGAFLRLEIQRGWPSVPAEARLLRRGKDLRSQAVVQKKLRSVRDFPVEQMSGPGEGDTFCLIAAPILHPGMGTCLGVISVESLPFVRFTRASASLLEVVAEIAAKALWITQDSFSSVATSDALLGAQFFLRRASMEMLSRQRGAQPQFTLLLIRLQNSQAMPSETRLLLERAMGLFFTVNFRPGDPRGRTDEASMAVVLLDTDEVTAERLRGKLADDICQFLPAWIPELPIKSIHIGWIGSDQAETLDELLLRAEERLIACDMAVTRA